MMSVVSSFVLESLEQRRLLSASGATTATVGVNYTLTLKPDRAATVSSWSINWGDGSVAQSLTGTATSATHSYASAGVYAPAATATYTSGSPSTTIDALGVDVSFANNSGKLVTGQLSEANIANGTAVQSDGKILVAGRTITGGDVTLSRYNADGTADTTFGSQGAVITTFAYGNASALSLAVAPDGSIYMAGFVSGSPLSGGYGALGIARYTSSGVLAKDGSNADWVVTTDLTNQSAVQLSVQSSGAVLIGGASVVNQSGNWMIGGYTIERYTANRTLDASFGSAGRLATAYSGYFGNFTNFASGASIVTFGLDSGNFVLRKYTADGVADTTFGSSGSINTGFFTGDDEAYLVTADASGRIIVGGVLWNGSNVFVLKRYTSAGSPDPYFGTNGSTGNGNGLVYTTVPQGTDWTNNVVVQPDNKIVVAGTSTDGSGNFDLMRFTTDGSLDTTFGSGGTLHTDYAGGNTTNGGASAAGNGVSNALSLQTVNSTTNILLGASVNVSGMQQFAFVRFVPNNQVSTSSNSGPTITTSAAASPSTVTGTTATLNVSATESGATLSYAWATTGTPPAAVTFANSSASSTMATFTKAGTYAFLVTVSDGNSHSVTSAVTVIVNQALTSIAVSPTSSSISQNATQQFAATAKDQFGTALTTQPSFAWSVSGVGTVNASTGLYSPGATVGSATVTATSGAVGGIASVTVTAATSTPYGGTAASAPGTIETENYDLGGEGVAYHDADSTNNGSSYRTADGVDIQTGGNNYDVGWTQTGEWMKFTINVATSGTYSLSARVASPGSGGTFHVEEDGTNVTGTLSVPDTGNWQSYQSVSTPGTFALAAGQHVLRLVIDSVGSTGYCGNFDSMSLALVNAGPVITSPAAQVTSGNVKKISAGLTVGAAESGATLTYTWATVGTPPASVRFLSNGTTDASATTAVFSAPGLYQFQVTVADSSGRTVTSDVSVTVVRALDSLTVGPSAPILGVGQSFQFVASAEDQFGAPIALPNDLTWTVADPDGTANPGVIGSSTGSYTAPAVASGPFTVSASSASTDASGDATVTVAAVAGPVGDWALNGTGGTVAADGSGYGNDGTLVGGPTWSGAPDAATGLFFSESGQYVNVAKVPLSGQAAGFTIATRLNATTWNGSPTVLEGDDAGGNAQFRLGVESGLLAFRVGSAVITTAVPTVGFWHSIVATFKPGDAMHLYIDGVDVASSSVTTGPSSFGPLGIGGKPGGGGDTFSGTVAEAEIYDHATTAGDVASVLAAPSVISVASAGQTTVVGTQTTLSALGTSPAGESTLTYTWVTLTKPAGSAYPSFSLNGTNESKNTAVAFFDAGTYELEVRISDGTLTATSTITINVQQTLTSLTTLPVATVVANYGGHRLVAIEKDQFGHAIDGSPAWSLIDPSEGMITYSGGNGSPLLYNYSAPSSGSGTVVATASATDDSHTVTSTIQFNYGPTGSSAWSPAGAPMNLTATPADGTNVQLSWTRIGFTVVETGSGGSELDDSFPLGYDPANNEWFGHKGDVTVTVTKNGSTLAAHVSGDITAMDVYYSNANASGWPNSVPSSGWAQTGNSSADLGSTTMSIVPGGTPQPDSYLVEGSTDGGITFNPLGTVAGDATSFLATGLVSSATYLFRVTPYNANGLGFAATTAVTTEVGATSTAGWYKITLGETNAVTGSGHSFTDGNAYGSVSVTNTNWVWADSLSDAVQKTVVGSEQFTNSSDQVTFGKSSAFRFVLDYSNAGVHYGPTVVLTDPATGDVHFWQVSSKSDSVVVQALTTQTIYDLPAGTTSVGTFSSGDASAVASDFSAVVTWGGGQTSTATVTAISDGFFGVYLTSIPAAVDPTSYRLDVTHIVDGATGNAATGAAAATLPAPNWQTDSTAENKSRVHQPYTPEQVDEAYGLTALRLGSHLYASGQGVTVGLIEIASEARVRDYQKLVANMDVFSAKYSLPTSATTSVSFYQATLTPQQYDASADGAELETNLDIQWLHSVAPNASIRVYFVPNTPGDEAQLTTDFNAAIARAEGDGVSVISASLGFPVNPSLANPGHVPSATGVSIIASAGDSGSYESNSSPQYPAIEDDVLSVGGTALTMGLSKRNVWSRLTETPWAGSGGFDNQGDNTLTGTAVPDVGFLADPNTGVALYDQQLGGWANAPGIGGTSLGAPAWAGIMALVDQGRGVSDSLDINDAIYAINHKAFFSVGGRTGRGTPVGPTLVAALIRYQGR